MVFFPFVAVSGLFYLTKRANVFAFSFFFFTKRVLKNKLDDQNDKNSY